MTTETEAFWAGNFGNEYTDRNQLDWRLKIPFFRKIIQLATPESILEVGCNRGLNLRAIAAADPNIEIAGCDINEQALDIAEHDLPQADIELCAAEHVGKAFSMYGGYSLVMTAGLLIHIAPEDLARTMESIAVASDEWILAIEYDHPEEQEIEYRGNAGKLWRRPYGKLYQDMGLKLVYQAQLGPQDGFGEGCTAWLLKKVAP